MKSKTPLQNQYLQPVDSPIDDKPQQKFVPWQFGIKQGMQLKKIRSSTGYFKKLSAGAIGSVTSIIGGTVTQSTITTSSFDQGTLTNSNFSGTISQPVSTGGTFTNPTVNTGTFNNSQFTGTFNNATLGSPTVTGGTANFATYQTGGTGGVSGSIIYVKTIAPTFGTLSFTNGLITSFN